MNTTPPSCWWFSKVSVRQAPASLKIQLSVVVAFYLLVFGVPGISHLCLGRGIYFDFFDLWGVIYAISNSAAMLVIFWYLVRIEGGSWKDFWDSKILPNVICLFYGLLILAALHVGSQYLTTWAAHHCRFLLPCLSPDVTALPAPHWYYFIAAALVCVTLEEFVVRGYIFTRMRQTGGSLVWAIFLSTLLYSTGQFAYGINVFLSSLVAGILLGIVYARWGGLAGFILARVVWESFIYFK